MKEETRNTENQPDQSISQSPTVTDVGKVTINESQGERAESAAIIEEPKIPDKPWIGRQIAQKIREWWQVTGKTESSNRIIALATLAIALATALSTYEIVTGSNDTKKIVDASQRIQTALETANTNNKEALDATIAQSKQSLDATIAASRLDQRAWVGPIGIGRFEFKTGEFAPSLTVTIRNSGKTPALKFSSDIAFRPFRKKDRFSPIFSNTEPPQSIDVIQPNMEEILVSPPGPNKLTQSDIDLVTAGELILYFYGRLQYNDVFGGVHRTTFCLIVNRDLKTMNTCDTYNQAD